MFASKFIDAVNKKRGRLISPPWCDPDDVANIVKTTRRAMKFDFGTIPMEKYEYDKSNPSFALMNEGDHGYQVPALTRVEVEAWIDGLLPLPFDQVWYEFSVPGETALEALLVEHLGDSWTFFRITFDKETDEFVFDGFIYGAKLSDAEVYDDEISIKIGQMLLGRRGSAIFRQANAEEQRRVRVDYSSALRMSIYLTLMLNSRTTEIRTPEVEHKLSKANVRRGYEPLYEHRVVNIVPKHYVRSSIAEAQGTHAPPRLHWRRSHVRTLHEGEPNEKKVVVSRHLVGRRDLGQVSHEYRVHLE